MDRFCNRVVEWVRLRMAETDFEGWMMRIETPPGGVRTISDEEAMASFLSARRGT